MVDIREAATRKIGPLPAWAWGAVIGGGFLVYRFATGGGSSSSSQVIGGGVALPDAGGGGGGGGSNIQDPLGDGTTPTPTTTVTYPNGYPGPYPQPFVPFQSYVSWLTNLRTADPTAYASYIAAPPAGSGTGGTLYWIKQLQAVDPAAADAYLSSHPEWTTPTATSPIGTGDTSANQPPTLGLPIGLAIARAQAATYNASRYMAALPDTPTAPITVPGTYSPTLVPIVRVQGDTARYQDVRGFLTPRGWVVAGKARLRQYALPTTSRRPLVLPASVRDTIGRVTAPRNG